MADTPRRSLEPAGLPRIEHQPGLANELLRELAPLLAEEGFDVDDIEAADLETLQAAMNRAVERRNLQLFSPVGATRDTALVTVRLVVDAVLDGDTTHTRALLDQVVPESPDNTAATVASCIGIALGLLDDWLSGRAPDAHPLSSASPRPGGPHYLPCQAAWPGSWYSVPSRRSA